VAAFAKRYPKTPVATTEPVGDYMLEAAGTVNENAVPLQADIMNGVDPAPQAVTFQASLFSRHLVKVFVYNQQVTDSLTASFLADAKKYGVPSSASTRRCRPPLRLPVVDARRDQRPAEGRGRQGLHAEAVTGDRSVDGDAPIGGASILSVERIDVRLAGRDVLREVSFAINPGSSPG